MKRTWTTILLACFLALIPAALLAESLENRATEEIISAVPTKGVQFDIRFQYMPSIKYLQGTNLIIMESKTDNTLGVFTTEGQEVLPYGFSAVNSLGKGFLSVSKNKNELNGLALYKTDGTQISDFIYGLFSVRDSHWVGAVVLRKSPNKEMDLTLNNVKYLIEQYDIYFVSEDDVTLVASLNRAQIKASKQHGEYFAIQSREDGTITTYDRNGQPVQMELKDVKDAFFQVTNYQLINKVTGELIANGYIDVTEADTPYRMLLIASIIDMDGIQKQAILDTDGNELMPPEYTVVALNDPYVVVANENGLRGLYSLDEHRLVVPCQFTDVIASETSVDQYINNGYICVEKEGKLGFVNALTGEVTCPPAYNSRIAKAYGCSLLFDGENGFVLVAGDGTRTELFEYEEMPATNGDGYLLVAKKNGYYGVIDWHGNEKLPFIHKTIITFTDDSKAMIRTSTGLELDVITAR